MLLVMGRKLKDIKTAWKQKIDPAFDTLIKFYVNSLTQFENNPREGRLNVPNDFIESIIKKFGGLDVHEMDIESFNLMFSFLEKVGLVSKNDIKIFSAFFASKNVADIFKTSPEMIAALPEKESRQFYNDKLEFYKKNPDLIPDSEILDKKTLNFYSVVFSLSIRFIFAKLYDDQKEIIDPEIEFFKKSGVLIPILSVILSSFSQLAHEKTLVELKENIIKGDDKSLFKAVTIDKNLLYLDDVKKRIARAQLSGDSDFFNRLGKAIASNPLKSPAQHGKTYAALNMFWLMGLYRLTNEELYYFLESCGLNPPDFPDAFQKFVKRHIRSVYNF
jgi:hypothetical protein